MDNEISKITLTDENGDDIEFDVITKLDIQEKEYVIVVPSDADEDSEAVALRIDKGENDVEVLVSIDDEEEFEMVQEAYFTIFADDSELN